MSEINVKNQKKKNQLEWVLVRLLIKSSSYFDSIYS